jgi:hypothetical protein
MRNRDIERLLQELSAPASESIEDVICRYQDALNVLSAQEQEQVVEFITDTAFFLAD